MQTETDANAGDELSALQTVLLTGLAGLQREPSGLELYRELAESCEQDLDLLSAAELSNEQRAGLRELAGAVFTTSRLARLIRGAVAESVIAAVGKPQELVLVCRALKHLPAWALEDDSERHERIAAEQEWRRTRGRRPGRKAGGELFNDEPEDDWEDPADLLGPEDAAVLEALCPARERRQRGMDKIEATGAVYSAWVDIARNTGPQRDLRIRKQDGSGYFSREEARLHATEIERRGIGGCVIRTPFGGVNR